MAGLENFECIWKIQRKPEVVVSVSLTENILCILAETPFMVLRRYIMLIRSFSKGRPILQICYFQKSPMLENSYIPKIWVTQKQVIKIPILDV
jgi:hypothetical protein